MYVAFWNTELDMYVMYNVTPMYKAIRVEGDLVIGRVICPLQIQLSAVFILF